MTQPFKPSMTWHSAMLSQYSKYNSHLRSGKIAYEARRILPPRFVIDRVLKEMRGFIGVPAHENILYTSLEERLNKIEELPEHERIRILGK